MSNVREMSLTLEGDVIWLTIAGTMYELDELDAVDLLARLRAILDMLATGENISLDGEDPYLADRANIDFHIGAGGEILSDNVTSSSMYLERLVARYVDIG
jgi:hypothetical protein